jgi:hypothetical protein
MNKRITTSLFLIFIFLFGGCNTQATAPAETQTPVESAVLSELSGKVELKNPGNEAFIPATADTTLEINGQIQTGDDGRARLDLSSGTIIRVAPSSLFTLATNDQTDKGLVTKIQLEIGKIFIILNGGSTDVETTSGVASVRGSYMKVEVDPVTHDIYVTCLEGHCSANNPAGSVDFTNGQKVILFHQDPATGKWTAPNVEPMTPEEFQEWLDANPEARDLFNQAMATLTAMPTATEAEAPASQATEPPAASCFKLLEPTDGANLPFQGKVDFTWESQPGADKYIISFVDDKGKTVSFVTSGTDFEQYIENLPKEGTYSWNVSAVGADGKEICKAEGSKFSKPNSVIEKEPLIEETQPPVATQPPATQPPATQPPPCTDYCNPSAVCYDPYQCYQPIP